VWPEATRDGLVGNCAEAGVLGPVPGVLGSLQALEVLKLVLGLPSAAEDAVVLVDLGTLATRRIRAPRAPCCAGGVCARLPAATAEAETAIEVDVAALEDAAANDYVVVDLRDAVEAAREPAPGPHLHIPLDRLLDDPAQLDAAGRYLLLCARGQRSRAAALALRRAGLHSVWSLRGGLAARRAP
jgi:sulfur-carrier protein adenylyltransferase/sulfurtransferase